METKNIIIGIIFILIGLLVLFFTIKHPTKGDLSYVDYNGYVGGGGFILLGMGFLIGHLHF